MDAQTAINAASFLTENFEGVLDTHLVPIPIGEHLAVIGTGEKDVDFQFGVSQKSNKPWMRVDLMLDYPDPNLASQLKREKVRSRWGIMIDLDENGKPDFRPQRNIRLGQLRDAVGQNKPGPWNFNMLKGQQIKVRHEHEPNEKDPQSPYSNVVAVTKAV
jgi:hypothetical protein